MNDRDAILLFAMQLVPLEEPSKKLTKIFGKLAVLSLSMTKAFIFWAFSFHH